MDYNETPESKGIAMIAIQITSLNLDAIDEHLRYKETLPEITDEVRYIIFDRFDPYIIVNEQVFKEKYEIDYVLSDYFKRYLVNLKR